VQAQAVERLMPSRPNGVGPATGAQ
jgi:hypothetical protein